MKLGRTVAVAIALSVCADARSQADDKRCATAHPHAERGQTVVATMSVVNDGEPCAMRLRLGGHPATSTVIRARPANGKLTSMREGVSYTPNPGFVGKDAFDVQWFGIGFGPNSASQNFRTKVDVTVRAKGADPESRSAKPAP